MPQMKSSVTNCPNCVQKLGCQMRELTKIDISVCLYLLWKICAKLLVFSVARGSRTNREVRAPGASSRTSVDRRKSLFFKGLQLLGARNRQLSGNLNDENFLAANHHLNFPKVRGFAHRATI